MLGWPFPKQILLVLAIACVLGLYPLLEFASSEVIVAVLAGAGLTSVNVLAGYAVIEYSIDKSYATVLKMVLGGMGVRMAVMLGTLILLIKVFDVHVVALIASVMGFYIVYLGLEVMFIQKRFIAKNQG